MCVHVLQQETSTYRISKHIWNALLLYKNEMAVLRCGTQYITKMSLIAYLEIQLKYTGNIHVLNILFLGGDHFEE